MSRRLFNLIALCSALVLPVLLLAYFVYLGLSASYVSSATGNERGVRLSMRHGQIRCVLESAQSLPGSAPMPPGLHMSPSIAWQPSGPGERRFTIWSLRAYVPATMPGRWTLFIACPIWLAAFPFMIAPLAWLRRYRQKRRQSGGFEVLQAPSDQES